MNAVLMYGHIWSEALKLLKSGALSKAGRPPADPDTAVFHSSARAFQKAVAAMPSAHRREWTQAVKALNQDVLTTPEERARVGAATRRRLHGRQALPAHLRETQARAVLEKLARHLAIRSLMAAEKRGLKAKQVTRLLAAKHPHIPMVAIDTVRKDLAEIRRSSHIKKF